MSGKKTYRIPGGHPTSQGLWLSGLPDATWHVATDTLGRHLPPELRKRFLNRMRKRVTRILQRHAPQIKDIELHRVGREDRIATLRGLAGGDVADEGKLDEDTRALLLLARYAHRVPSAKEASALLLRALDGDATLDAAFVQQVNAAVPANQRGRPGSSLGPLLRELVQAWRDFGGKVTGYSTRPSTDTSVSANDDRYATPVVHFVRAFVNVAAAKEKSLTQVGRLLSTHVPR